MISLIKILHESLKEANAERDLKKDELSKEYIKKINSLIDKGKVEFFKIGDKISIKVNLKDVIVRFFNSSHNDYKASYDSTSKPKPYINVFKCAIETKPKLSISYDEDALRHEIIHHLDYNSSKTSRDKLKVSSIKQAGQEYDSYINSPLETNAHFFERFIPEILKYLNKEKEIPDTFNDFKKGLLEREDAKEFYESLNEKNKRKLDKRLSSYYLDILKNPNFKIEKANNSLDSNRLDKATKGFWSKIKDVFK